MRLISLCGLGLIGALSAFCASITLNTGQALWMVTPPSGGSTMQALAVSPNAAWVTPPAGASWVSWSSVQSLSCTASGAGSTIGTDCANGLYTPAGPDVAVYSLTFTSAQLGGATSGALTLSFAADNRLALNVGQNSATYSWSGSPANNTNGQGYTALGCATGAGATGPASGGNCQSILFNASNLSANGSLTLTVYDFNDPLPAFGAPGTAPQGFGNPSGLLMVGSLTTNTNDIQSIPEPATLGLTTAGLAALAFFKKRFRNSPQA